MRRLLLLTLLTLLPVSLAAQGVNHENFSQGTVGAAPTSTDMGNSLYGTLGTCCFVGQTPFTAIQNSNSTLTYTNTSACSDGGPPATINGITTHSGLILDYNTTQGNGHNNQIIFLRSPNEVGTITMGGFWFCTDIPVTDSFGTTNDFLQVIGGSSRLANFNSDGTSQNFGIESCTGPCQGTIPRGTVGTTLYIAWQHVQSAACVNADHTDCVRLAIYNRNLQLVGEEDATVGAGVISYETFGNGNPAALSSGHHMQFSDIWTCWIGCKASMFPLLPNNPQLGIITAGRGTDWSKAGIPGNNSGTLPSSTWTQFGTALTAGSYAGSTITANMVGCNNQFYQLGAGTFTVTGNINVPSNCELRGLGANTTFLVASGAASNCRAPTTALVCIKTTGDSTFIGNTPAVDCNWTAGYAQGATQITLSACTGAGITSIVPGTVLALNQCGTGYSGANNCTGTATDNGGLYMCLDRITATPTGCSANGGGTYERPTIELPVVTAINTGTGVATISPPLTMPNYSSGQTPQAQIIQPVTMAGVKDLSIDLSASSVNGVCVQLFDAYKAWIRGVRCLNNKFAAFQIDQTANYIVEDNYLYGTTATPPSGYGIRPFYSAYGLIANNISQNVYTPMFQDSPTMATVWAYNFVINNNNVGNTFMNQAFTDHWPNCYTLAEGNIANQFNPDDAHGAACVDTTNRNLWTGWESTPPTPKSSNTVAIQDQAFTRYHNHIFDVLGTPGYHTLYSTLGNNNSVLWLGQGVGGVSPPVPSDPLTASTTLRWGSYNVVNATVRYCGNALNTGWSTICSSTSEAPASAPTLPGTVPAVGDTAKGQPAPPPSFIFTSRPIWYQNTKPFPLIGPDVTGGNLGQCSGSLNVVGQFNGVPALTNAQCGGHGITASAWAGHVNSNPAMDCYLNVMNGLPDGSGAVLSFNADACYLGGGGGTAATPTFSPAAGAYLIAQIVTITSATGGATLCVTIDGTIPTANGAGTCTHGSTLANGGTVTVTFTQRVQAIASQSGLTDSAVGVATYTLPTVATGTMFARAD